MRIAKATLSRRWRWTTGLGLAVFAMLVFLDWRLKTVSGVGIADLQFLSSAVQFRAVLRAWSSTPYAIGGGFGLGLEYLLMPLYALSFFYSGVIVAEAFAPRPGRLRHLLLLAAMVPPAGALCHAAQNALDLAMFLGRPDDFLAGIALGAARAKAVGQIVGLVLLAGAAIARRPKSARGAKSPPESGA